MPYSNSLKRNSPDNKSVIGVISYRSGQAFCGTESSGSSWALWALEFWTPRCQKWRDERPRRWAESTLQMNKRYKNIINSVKYIFLTYTELLYTIVKRKTLLRLKPHFNVNRNAENIQVRLIVYYYFIIIIIENKPTWIC